MLLLYTLIKSASGSKLIRFLFVQLCTVIFLLFEALNFDNYFLLVYYVQYFLSVYCAVPCIFMMVLTCFHCLFFCFILFSKVTSFRAVRVALTIHDLFYYSRTVLKMYLFSYFLFQLSTLFVGLCRL